MRDAESLEPRGRTSSRVRLADVARDAGVGVSIASRVLNDDPTVSTRPETRRRILEASRRLGYRPNAFARGLKLQRTMTIGVVLPNLAYSVNSEIIRGAEREAAGEGYVTLLADAQEFGRAGQAYQRFLHERRVDGLLIASATTNDRVVEMLAAEHQPFVLLNRRRDDLGISVSMNDEAGVECGVDHMAALGHRRIAHLAGPQDTDTGRRRRDGFLRAMLRLGLPVAANAVAEAPFTEEGGFKAMQRLLAERQRPTAVVAGSLAAAVGACAAVHRHGLHVPGDISFVAFHDAAIAEYLNPPLSTIRMPLREMAQEGVRVLIRMMNNEQVTSVVMPTPPELIERTSTAPPPRALRGRA